MFCGGLRGKVRWLDPDEWAIEMASSSSLCYPVSGWFGEVPKSGAHF